MSAVASRPHSVWMLLTSLALVWGCATSAVPNPPAPSPSFSESDPLAMVAQGQLRIEMGELAEGLKLMRRALELDPGSDELRQELGLAMAEAGIGDEAVKLLSGVGTLSPPAAATLGLLLAQRAESPADLGAAVKQLQASVDKLPPTGQAFQARVTLASLLVRLERGGEAWEQVKVLLDERPDDPRLLLLAGQALRLDGKNDEALEYFRRAGTTPELKSRATLEEVETLAIAGKYKEAAELMGGFLKENGASLGALTRWATLLARSGDDRRAREVLGDVLAKDGTIREALLLKAALDAGAGQVDSAEQLYRRALALEPKDPDAAVGLARLLMDLRRFSEARTLLDTVWTQLDESKPGGAEARHEIARDRAALELMDHHADDALAWLKRLEEKDLSRRTLALWAEYFRQRQAWREGLEWLQKAAVENQPPTQRLYKSTLAEMELAAGDTKAAEEILKPFLDGEEDDVEAALAVLQRRKLFEEVVTRARTALTRFPDSLSLRFDLAAALERSGKWDDSVKEFRAILAKDGEHGATLNYLGYMFADRGVNLQEAKDMLTRAVASDPTSGAFLDSLGWVYFRLGDLDRAEKHLTEAVRLEPFDATVHEHLGDLFKARGDLVKAGEYYREALTMELEETGQKERLEKKLGELAAGNAK
jgi:tetratricopeptide (TPR) repeat protein